jgi:hypothetical protein
MDYLLHIQNTEKTLISINLYFILIIQKSNPKIYKR